MVIQITGVLEDGAPAAQWVPFDARAPIEIPSGITTTIVMRLVTRAGVAVRLASGDQLLLTARESTIRPSRLYFTASAVAVPDLGPGMYRFTIQTDTTKYLGGLNGVYDVRLVRSGYADSVIPTSAIRFPGVAAAAVPAPAVGPVILDLSPADLGPSVQSIPTTIAAANALSGATFTEIWKCNATSGNLVGANGAVLTSGGSAANRYAKMVPAWDGTDYTSSYRAIEFAGTDSTAQSFAASSGAAYGLSQSVTWVMAVRLPRALGGTRGIFGCKSSSDATGVGYCAQMSSGGAPTLVVSDGSTSATAQTVGVLTEQDALANGSIQWMAFQMNLTTGLATVMAYRAVGTPVVMPAGSKVAATAWRLGGQPYLFSGEGLQVLWMGVLLGTNAEAFTLSMLNAMDNVCRAPAALAGHVRYSCLAPIIGSDATGVRVQMLAGSAVTPSKIDFAHAYAAAATSPGKIGILCERGTTIAVDNTTTLQRRNRLLNSDDFANASWVKTNVTPVARAGEDPAGFHGAASLTASAGSGTVTQNFTGTASETHTNSFFGQRNQGTDVAARLSLYDVTGAPVELAGVNITIGALRERFAIEVPAATIGAVTALQWRLTITTSGHSIFAWGGQAQMGWLGSYQPQRAALISADDTEFYIDNAAGQAFDIVGGRVEVTCTGHHATVDSTGCYVFSTNTGAANEDRFVVQRDALRSTYPHDSQHRNAAGTIIAQIARPTAFHTAEITYAHEWDSRLPIIGESVRALDDVGAVRYRSDAASVVHATTAWTTGSAADRLTLGMRHNNVAHLEGIITAVRTYGRAT